MVRRLGRPVDAADNGVEDGLQDVVGGEGGAGAVPGIPADGVDRVGDPGVCGGVVVEIGQGGGGRRGVEVVKLEGSGQLLKKLTTKGVDVCSGGKTHRWAFRLMRDRTYYVDSV